VKATGRMMFNFKEAASVFVVNIRCGVLGFIMGVLPGAGATLASAVAYMTEKRIAGASGKFGKAMPVAWPRRKPPLARPAVRWCRC
jgi:putative tricarboxylic transport membrane protein